MADVKVSACGTAEFEYVRRVVHWADKDFIGYTENVKLPIKTCEPAHPTAVRKEAYAKMALQLLFEDKCKQLSCSAWKFLDGPSIKKEEIKKEEIKAPREPFLPLRPKL